MADSPQPERQAAASIFNAMMAAATRMGLRDPIRQHASPELRALIDQPPRATTLIPGHVLDEFYAQAVAARGPTIVRDLMLDACRQDVGRILRPIIESTLSLYGRSPNALFLELASITAPINRHITYEWTPADATSGSVIVRPPTKPNPAFFSLWEGVFLYFFDVCGVSGVVEAAEPVDGGMAARIRVSW